MENNNLQEIEKSLWESAEQLRGKLEANHPDFRDTCLWLIFLKYISDKFNSCKNKWDKKKRENPQLVGDEKYERDWYRSHRVIYVPNESHWSYVNKNKLQPNLKQIIDKAFSFLAQENEELSRVFPTSFYSRIDLDNDNIAKLLDTFSNKLPSADKENDDIGIIYEYFLGKFAFPTGERSKSGEFYTPRCVVKLLVELIEPFRGKIYDPCCGSGGMFIQAAEFVRNYKKNGHSINIYGQEKATSVWRVGKTNTLLRGLECDLGDKPEDTFKNDLHKNLDEKVDFILSNPPFNQKWEAKEDPIRWKYGLPPKNNANFAWLQHMISKLNDKGVAVVILANNSVSAAKKEEEIRKNILEDNLVDAIIRLPDKLFYNTGIPVTIWIIRKGRDRKDVFFADCSDFEGEIQGRKVRVLKTGEIKSITKEYHSWLNNKNYLSTEFTAKADLEEIKKKDYLLLPGIYTYQEEKPRDPQEIKKEIRLLSSEILETFHRLETEKKEIEELLTKLKKDGEVD